MTLQVADIERITILCRHIRLPDEDNAEVLLQALSQTIGARSAVYRCLVQNSDGVQLNALQTHGLASSVTSDYLNNFQELDPMRFLLSAEDEPKQTLPVEAQCARLLPPDPLTLETLSSKNPGQAHFYKTLDRYRHEFLIPHNLYHHLGFYLQSGHNTWVLNFHRPSHQEPFDQMDQARLKLCMQMLLNQLDALRAANRMPQSTSSITLTDREQDICEGVAQGQSNKLIASQFGISVRTVENHLRNIYQKYSVSSRTQLLAQLYRTPLH